MTTWLIRCFAGLLLVLPLIPAVADDPDDKEIARLVKQLGSSDFRTRDEARKRLEELGEPALDALVRAMKTNDPEVRRRAEEIVAVLENKLYVEQVRLTGHTGKVWSVSIAAGGKRLLTSSDDKTLRLWDADTGKQLRVFEGHTERIVGAALSPDGKRVLSGSCDRTVRLWDATTGKELCQMAGHMNGTASVAFGPQGKAISGGDDRAMRLWDLNTGREAGVFTGHASLVRSVAYSGKARLAATCSNDHSVRLWSLETGKEIRRLVTEEVGGSNVCFSPDGERLLATNSDEHGMRIWDVGTGKELKRIQAPNLFSAAFSPDGKRIVTGGNRDNMLRVWDAATGKELRQYEGHAGAVVGVTFFPDGKRFASASHDGTVRIWRAPR